MRGFTATASLSEGSGRSGRPGCGGSREGRGARPAQRWAAAAERVTMESGAAALRDQRGQVIGRRGRDRIALRNAQHAS